jgi:hypothetical protein
MNKKINKILMSAMITACGLSMVGCTDLDETLYDTISSEQHEFSQTELEHTIAPVYSSLRSVYWGWFGMSDVMDMSSDVWGVPSRIGIGWGDLYVSMHKHQLNNQMGFFTVNWDNNYAGVNACNKILANTAIASNEDIVAQVRAYRALYYYNLLDLYRNIPLDTTYVHEAGWTPEQSDPTVVYDWIESELKAVADKCPK